MPTKSNRSLTSFKSTKSIRTHRDSLRGNTAGELIDLVNILPTVSAKLQCPYNIIVKKEQQQDEFLKSIKCPESTVRQRRRLSILPTPTVAASQESIRKPSDAGKDLKPFETETMQDNSITISAIYDKYNCLTEIFLNEIEVPRILMQVITLFVPYFHNLSTLRIRQCKIDCYTLYEISKILELSTITSIVIDNSPVLQHTYEVILHEKSNLRNLTLCRCQLNDEDCRLIAINLYHGASGDNLQVLNLSSNYITDVGVKYISDALRSNRRLRYLSLADNRIEDEGASYLLNVLKEFALTYDEIVNMKLRYMKYLKWKQALYSKYLIERDKSFDELNQITRKSAKKKLAKKDRVSVRKYSDENVRQKAESLAFDILGQFIDPFDSNSIKVHDNYYYCVGNMVLCYINMAYNNLSFLTVKKLINVLTYQNIKKKANETGLIKVVIEGNNLPMCTEIVLLNELLDRNIKNVPFKIDPKRRRSRIV